MYGYNALNNKILWRSSNYRNFKVRSRNDFLIYLQKASCGDFYWWLSDLVPKFIIEGIATFHVRLVKTKGIIFSPPSSWIPTVSPTSQNDNPPEWFTGLGVGGKSLHSILWIQNTLTWKIVAPRFKTSASVPLDLSWTCMAGEIGIHVLRIMLGKCQ